MLTNRVFVGDIVHKPGTPEEQVFAGRHQPLIDRATFEKVQTLLHERRVTGERSFVHQHFLRGVVYCDTCGHRLIYGVSRSHTGKQYAYYFCGSRVSGPRCEQRSNLRPELIDAAICDFYGRPPVRFTPADAERAAASIRQLAKVSNEALDEVRVAKLELVGRLKQQQQRLLRLFMEEGEDISPDASRAERQRIQREIANAEQSIEETEGRLQLNEQDLVRALELAADVQSFYEGADEATKRTCNLAFSASFGSAPKWTGVPTRQL